MALSGEDLFGKGNEAFVAENYTNAIEFYTKALDDDSENANVYVNRSHAFLKLERYEQAVQDADKAIALGCKDAKVYLRKGIALFRMEKFIEAKETLLQVKDFEGNAAELWISKCDEKLSPSAATTAVPRHDWYQTESHVVVTVLFKDKNITDFNADIGERKLTVVAQVTPGKEFKLDLSLAHNIVPEESTKKIFPTKIEIKLKKRDGIRWNRLEGDSKLDVVKQFTPVSGSLDASTTVHKYPTSSVYRKDWDKIAVDLKKEEEQENVEGEAAMNQLFEKIYADGSDEVKRAMNKSFSESGGTVLSTNWNDVGAKKMDVKPPEGLEYRKWD